MILPLLCFQVRIDECASLIEMGRRVALALDCAFAIGEQDGEQVLIAKSLGLDLVLSAMPVLSAGPLRYVLIGSPHDEIEHRCADESPWMNISEYVVGLLRLLDSADWYIPDVSELLAEAGLPARRTSDDRRQSP